jgi:hypothetical protein
MAVDSTWSWRTSLNQFHSIWRPKSIPHDNEDENVLLAAGQSPHRNARRAACINHVCRKADVILFKQEQKRPGTPFPGSVRRWGATK